MPDSVAGADTERASPRPLCLVAKSCPTLCHPMDLARQVSRPMGILQVRILEWVARPPPGDSPKPGIEPGCPELQVGSYRLSPREAHSGRNRLVDTGNLTQHRRPIPGWANSHSLGVGEDLGRAIMGAHRVFSCTWIYFGSGPQDWSPGSRYLWGLWHLWSVEGMEVAPFPWGQGSYPRKKCQPQRFQEKPVLLSP